MIPGKNNKKYKYLPRIRIDVFNNLKTKLFRKKKWRQILRQARNKQAFPLLPTHTRHPLSKFPHNLRYYYKNTMFIKLGFQLFYGGIQDYKLKAKMRQAYKASPRNSKNSILNQFENRIEYVLYRLNLVSSISEGLHHLRYKRVFVNNNTEKNTIKVGDVLHFSKSLRQLAERRLFKGRLKILPLEIDFEAESMRFYIYRAKTTYSHPYIAMFRRLSKWYSV